MGENSHNLAPGTVLHTYTIDKTLNAGGFGIVYLAVEDDSNHLVVIKEYLPAKVACRDGDGQVQLLKPEFQERFNEGRKLFIHEGNAIKRLDHPAIVRARNFFEANNTLYMVMDFAPGENLQAVIAKRHGNLSENFLLTVFPALLDGLREVHNANMLHLDIKPGNIHIRPGGSPVLLDFGAVHRMDMSRQFQPKSVITPGFSPIEQYENKGYIGPWTDIYALGATMRSCIEGSAPPDAKLRREKDAMRPAAVAFKRKYSQDLLNAIDWAMEIDPTLRPQKIDQLVDILQQCVLLVGDDKPGGMFNRLVSNLWK
ncbi:MAG: serine/threonine protein kinase [Gammaproteobacteria bacterium]|jgi:serine/threonine protein kinase|nr:serine/threonine protein kinase [Gammaproteobacteria bacterium]